MELGMHIHTLACRKESHENLVAERCAAITVGALFAFFRRKQLHTPYTLGRLTPFLGLYLFLFFLADCVLHAFEQSKVMLFMEVCISVA